MVGLTISNTLPVLSADPTTLGAAIKIMIAGGSSLDKDGMRQASGTSPHVWTRKRDGIVALVRALEA